MQSLNLYNAHRLWFLKIKNGYENIEISLNLGGANKLLPKYHTEILLNFKSFHLGQFKYKT